MISSALTPKPKWTAAYINVSHTATFDYFPKKPVSSKVYLMSKYCD